MKKRRLITDAPKLLGDELSVAGEEIRRTVRLVHVEGFDVGVVRPLGDIVKLEVGEGGHLNDAVVRSKAWRRQFAVSEIHGERRRVANTQVAGGVVWIRFCENPALVVQRQRRHMAGYTANGLELSLAVYDRLFDCRVVLNQPGR